MQGINSTILSLYPSSKGICFAVFDSPKDLVDYGIGYVRPVNNKKSMLKVEQFISYYKPDIVLVRELTHPNSKRNKRNQELIDLICKKAKDQGLEVHQYSRPQIKEVFTEFKAVSKFQISKKLMEWFPKLKTIELPIRKRWMGENHNAGIFDAIAIGLVHFYLKG